jgi:hypothetical protein
MVKDEKYSKPPQIAVPALQAQPRSSYAHKFALALEEAKEHELDTKRERLRLVMEDGSFKALLSSTRRPNKLKAAKQTTVTPAQEALVGRVFQDEGTWKILKVEWDSGLDSIIVFYYDFNAAEREMIDEDDLDEDHEYVEHSSIEEVVDWMSN